MSASINYHELTMEESKDSPARKKQFLVICVLGIGAFTNAFVNAGGFLSVPIQEAEFPGGEFYYRLKKGDYSTSMGHLQCTADTVHLQHDNEYADFLYSMYIDDTSKVSAVDARYFAGAMFHPDGSGDELSNIRKQGYKNILKIENRNVEDGEKVTKPQYESFCTQDKYEVQSLPPVEAGIAHFPNTNGFVSSVLQSLKVIPSMMKFAKQRGVSNPIALTTCSARQFMCTHYVILDNTEKYLMGEVPTDDHIKNLLSKKDSKDEEL